MKTYTIRYIAQLFFFLGIGLISGSIVHLSWDPLLYGTIGIVGILLFVGGTLLQKHIENKSTESYLKTIIWSVLFAAGVGIASGGIQHFFEVGIMGPLFIGIGLAVSFFVFGKKESLVQSVKNQTYVGIVSLILGGVFVSGGYLLLHSFSSHDMSMGGDHHANGGMYQTEQEFVAMMIPHHQEAIDTAEYIASQTTNPVLQELTNNIIQAQTKEIAYMQTLLPVGFDDFSYHTMMTDLTNLSSQEADRVFLEDMILHHQSAINDAIASLSISDLSPETKDMLDAIITTQAQEIVIMQNILESLE